MVHTQSVPADTHVTHPTLALTDVLQPGPWSREIAANAARVGRPVVRGSERGPRTLLTNRIALVLPKDLLFLHQGVVVVVVVMGHLKFRFVAAAARGRAHCV